MSELGKNRITDNVESMDIDYLNLIHFFMVSVLRIDWKFAWFLLDEYPRKYATLYEAWKKGRPRNRNKNEKK